MKKKKKYKIKEGGLLWHLKESLTFFWFLLVVAAILFVTAAFGDDGQTAKAASLPDEAVESATFSEMETVEYDVPLSPELQAHIKDLCDSYKVDMPLVLAIIGQESNYDAGAIGDNGDSLGLMQIQEQWHSKRMDKLKTDNLLDPYQNVEVGISILAELIKKGETRWAIIAYNAGEEIANYCMATGTTTEYAESVEKLREDIRNDKS